MKYQVRYTQRLNQEFVKLQLAVGFDEGGIGLLRAGLKTLVSGKTRRHYRNRFASCCATIPWFYPQRCLLYTMSIIFLIFQGYFAFMHDGGSRSLSLNS